MGLILNLETATPVCSVSLGVNGKAVGIKETTVDKSHAGLINIFIREILRESSYQLQDLDAVAVSAGPGSYTGLRIGSSTAKGLCYALDIPLIAVDTLSAMAFGANTDHKELIYCPMIDARRMEVYTAVYDRNLNCIQPASAIILDHDSFESFLNDQRTCFFGTGAAKFATLQKHPNAVFLPEFHCSANHMVQMSEKAFQASDFENLAYYKPFYLKEFQSTKKEQTG